MSQRDKKNQYWRSFDEKEQSPAFLKEVEEEFANGIPPGVDAETHEPLPVSRRDFLKYMGFGLASVAAACSPIPTEKAIPYLVQPEEIVPGKAYWYASTCFGCSSACGILVKTREGRPIKIEGNAESAINQGGLCATGQASVLELYDSGRLQGPLDQGKKVGWDNLDKAVLAKLNELQDSQKQIVFLTGTITSPTLKSTIDQFLSKYPNAKHVVYDAVSASGILDAHEFIFGKRILPHYRFDKARTIVSFGADFLGTWISPVEFAKQFSRGRKLDQKNMSQLYQFESGLSLTGANADIRVPLLPSQIDSSVLGLLECIETGEIKSAPQDNGIRSQIKKTAENLKKNKGRSLVVSNSNDIDVQNIVVRINQILGNYGHALRIDQGSNQKKGHDKSLDRLVHDMKNGQVEALFIYGNNPAYSYFDSKSFVEGLEKVSLKVSLDNRNHETAQLMDYHAPDHHFLESWGDSEPVEGVFHISQPTIRPVYSTRSIGESLNNWMGIKEDYQDTVKKYWEDQVFPYSGQLLFDSFWKKSVHDGCCKTNQFKPVKQRDAAQVISESVKQILKKSKMLESKQGWEIHLYESVALRDGQSANNPWLQELPDPITKLTWDNAANISSKDAKKLNVKQGDVIAIKVKGRTYKLPVVIQPGQASGSISLALGYGRTKAGKVGNGVGQNVYGMLNGSNANWNYYVQNALVSTTGTSEKLALTQTHYSLEGRPIFKDATLNQYKSDPAAGNKDQVDLVMLWEQHKTEGHSWGMAIDTNACIGCSGCMVGCQSENNVPVVGKEEVYHRREMSWIRLDRYYKGDEENPEVAFQPMMCQHCANAPCESVCPVLATVHSADGLNQQVYNRCVGTRYCANNCPYKVRRFNWFDYAHNKSFDYYMNDNAGKLALNPDVVVRSRGVMEKCSMCVQRIQEKKLEYRKQGKPLNSDDIKVACQQSCPSDAIVFGDLNDPKSQISKLLHKNKRRYQVLGELNVKPAVNYLTKIRNKE
ncbi:MAG: TAT-variant-translocated molybdopterin oxidoreductase [Deltaproteobacteria bacterium]|nr:TAT-variant-translocated molybdopterin oxidoreductase [Deltaproteobacteria bacterium]